MTLKLKVEDVVDIFSVIINSEEFDVKGKDRLPIYDRDETSITKDIWCLYKVMILHEKYEYVLHNEIKYLNQSGRKSCDLVFALTPEHLLNDNNNEIWI